MANERVLRDAVGPVLMLAGLLPIALAPVLARRAAGRSPQTREAWSGVLALVAGFLGGAGLLLMSGRILAAVIVGAIVALAAWIEARVLNAPARYKESLALVGSLLGERAAGRTDVGLLGYGGLTAGHDGSLGVWHEPEGAQPHVDRVAMVERRRVLERVYTKPRWPAVMDEIAQARSERPELVQCAAGAKAYAREVLSLLPERWSAALARSGVLEAKCTTFLPPSTPVSRAGRFELPWVIPPQAIPDRGSGPWVSVPVRTAFDEVAQHLFRRYGESAVVFRSLKTRFESELMHGRTVSAPVPLRNAEDLAAALQASASPLPLVGFVVPAEIAVPEGLPSSDGALDSLADSIVVLVVGAYDNETFLLFERTDKSGGGAEAG